MLDHIGITVSDLDVSKAFYERALAPLGLSCLADFTTPAGERVIGFGKDSKPFYWFGRGASARNLHVAFPAATRAEVDAFHAAALEAGGEDNGGPGVRAHYHPNYYGGFVHDPDGYNVEAVCHRPG